MKMTVKQRLKEYIVYKKISVRQFEIKCNLSNGYVNGIEKTIMPQKLSGISLSFPDLNIGWLLTGEGSMLRENSRKNEKIVCGIPLLPIEAVAGIAGGDFDGVMLTDCEHYNIPEFSSKGVEFLVRVSGSSMYPKYSNGDLLACRKVPEVLFLQWGHVYVIDSSQGALVKRVFEDTTNSENIICVSDNKENYPPFCMPKSDIRSLSLVVGVLRME